MKTHYTCGKCKELLEATEENFFPSSIKRVLENQNRTVIPKCKKCAKEYSSLWRKSIKEKGLTRNQQNTMALAGAVTGTIYVIGPKILGTPYKIGITSGSNTNKRRMALQTAHWLELKEIWKSSVLDRADIVEKKLHKHFERKKIRGEWFDLSEQDINDIPKLVNSFILSEHV